MSNKVVFLALMSSLHELRRRSPRCRTNTNPPVSAATKQRKTAALKFTFPDSPTCMYSLEVDVLLQLPSQVDLSAVLAHRPIVHQEEVGMQAVENVQFAERVQQRLIRSDNLQRG